MSNYEVTELTWENGQLAMHGLGGLLPTTTPTKPTWGRAGDTLESIVHQATYHKQNPNPHLLIQQDQIIPATINAASSSGGNKWSTESASGLQEQTVPGGLIKKKRRRSESEQCGTRTTFCSNSIYEEEDIAAAADRSTSTACAASASATFCRDKDKHKHKDKDNDTTMMTWASFESPRSFKTKTTHDDDSSCHGGSENRVEERESKGNETGRSHSMRRIRAVHNQSERRRRERINEKMETLMNLVPNASKTDKASMLDEVIEYLKQLQAQVQMMSSMRNMPAQMMMPLGMQQHLQMSLLARMGMGVGLGMGMGMFEMNNLARSGAPQTVPSLIHPTPFAATGPTFVPPPFLLPSMIPMPAAAQVTPNPAGTNASVPLLAADPYCTFLAQSMNMDLYNKMAALYQQQVNQTTQATTNPSQSHQGKVIEKNMHQ